MAIISANESNFENEVLNEKGKVLVDFNASWCGPCRMLAPIIEELEKEVKNVKIVSVDIDDNDELCEEYGIISVPSLVLFESGKEIKRNVGFMPKDAIEEFNKE